MSALQACPTLSLYSDVAVIRVLTAEDSLHYRALRKKILVLGDGRYFNTSYARENQLTEEQWFEWCRETREHSIIGTFVENQLIGVMMVTMFGAPEDHTAEWEATWLDPAYRGHGIAMLAYQKVQEWTKDQGYKYAKVFIRDDNFRSREIREKQGFSYIETIHNEVWADGSIASEHIFVKELTQDSAANKKPYDRALHYIDSTLDFFKKHVPSELHPPQKTGEHI